MTASLRPGELRYVLGREPTEDEVKKAESALADYLSPDVLRAFTENDGMLELRDRRKRKRMLRRALKSIN